MLDAADQSLLEAAQISLVGYQGYDKALDTYYLSVAYLSTLGNWENVAALQVGRALFYLRLAGVLAFELSNVRLLLAVLPNAYEPYFIYNEIMRRRGKFLPLTRGLLIMLAAAIWFVVKLPHEWWIHVARLDATDFIKTKILGASLGTPFWRAVLGAPLVTGALIVGAALLGLIAWRARKQHRSQHRQEGELTPLATQAPARSCLQTEPTRHQETTCGRAREAFAARSTSRTFRPFALLEKTTLVGAICLIFQQTLPGLKANGIQTALFVTVAIVAAEFLLRWVLRRLGSRETPRADILQTALLNFSFVLLFQLFVPVLPPRYNIGPALLFAALIALFVTLYDRYRPVYEMRETEAAATGT